MVQNLKVRKTLLSLVLRSDSDSVRFHPMTSRIGFGPEVVTFLAVMLAPLLTLAQANSPLWRNGAQEKMCSLGTYQDSLNLVFDKATAEMGETLVTVQVLPSFQREYALVLKRLGSDVKLLRVTLRDQLWTQLGPPLHVSMTRQQCLERARVAKVDVAEVLVPAATTEQFWTAFNKLNLDTDICARRKGKCAYFLDGTDYVIQTQDRLERLMEIGTLKGIQSENAPLLDWIHAVLRVAKASQSR